MTRTILAALALSLSLPLAAQAETMVDQLGDIDGFGGVVEPGGLGLKTWPGEVFDNRTAGDPDFTDRWLDGFEGVAPVVSWTHDLPGGATPSAAVIQMLVAGMADGGRGPWVVRVNGTTVGMISDGNGSNTTAYTFDVTDAVAPGSNLVELVYPVGAPDGFAIDMVRLGYRTDPNS